MNTRKAITAVRLLLEALEVGAADMPRATGSDRPGGAS